MTWYKLHKIYTSIPDLCWKGCGSQGSYVHCLWGCPRLQLFWDQVLHYAFIITDVRVLNTPTVLLLNIWETNKPSPITLDLIVLLLAAAKNLIMLHWKTTRISSIKDWFIKLWDLFLQDKISVAILQADNLPTPSNLQERWMPLLSAVSSIKIDWNANQVYRGSILKSIQMTPTGS